MPYIPQEDRRYLDPYVPRHFSSAGELNYFITKCVLHYIRQSGLGVRYHMIATVMGVLENVKQEFYRRVAVPYEESKKELHGDVY